MAEHTIGVEEVRAATSSAVLETACLPAVSSEAAAAASQTGGTEGVPVTTRPQGDTGEEPANEEINNPSIKPSTPRALQAVEEKKGILRGLQAQSTPEVSSMALRAVDEVKKVAERSRNLKRAYRGALWSAAAKMAATSLALVQRANNTDRSGTGEAIRSEAAADARERARIEAEAESLRLRVANLEAQLEEARRFGPSSNQREVATSPMDVDVEDGDSHGTWPRESHNSRDSSADRKRKRAEHHDDDSPSSPDDTKRRASRRILSTSSDEKMAVEGAAGPIRALFPTSEEAELRSCGQNSPSYPGDEPQGPKRPPK
ncbi:translation initiation factor IF-2-like [Odontomachus brunneus]|uniref:translation initiation factor IF-2-like n=1 Tax=Odontomachus brunneus TaxID=486640 RepID=UPI0013F1BAD9|nr:translation initiation factor IF-2-like [Odontomachus brunneus]